MNDDNPDILKDREDKYTDRIKGILLPITRIINFLKRRKKKDEKKGGIHMPNDYDVDHAIDEQLSKTGNGGTEDQ